MHVGGGVAIGTEMTGSGLEVEGGLANGKTNGPSLVAYQGWTCNYEKKWARLHVGCGLATRPKTAQQKTRM